MHSPSTQPEHLCTSPPQFKKKKTFTTAADQVGYSGYHCDVHPGHSDHQCIPYVYGMYALLDSKVVALFPYHPKANLASFLAKTLGVSNRSTLHMLQADGILYLNFCANFIFAYISFSHILLLRILNLGGGLNSTTGTHRTAELFYLWLATSQMFPQKSELKRSKYLGISCDIPKKY